MRISWYFYFKDCSTRAELSHQLVQTWWAWVQVTVEETPWLSLGFVQTHYPAAVNPHREENVSFIILFLLPAYILLLLHISSWESSVERIFVLVSFPQKWFRDTPRSIGHQETFFFCWLEPSVLYLSHFCTKAHLYPVLQPFLELGVDTDAWLHFGSGPIMVK